MNKEIAKSLYGYFETLYNINKKLIELCGVNILSTYFCCQSGDNFRFYQLIHGKTVDNSELF